MRRERRICGRDRSLSRSLAAVLHAHRFGAALSMARGLAFALMAAGAATSAFVTAVPAAAQDHGRISLSRALAALARDTGAELLFDENLVRGLAARPIGRPVSVEAGLAILLEGTGLGYRRTPDGAYVLDRPGRPPPPAPAEEAIAEILVTSRRTQNADIRRTENDIQPYRVTTARELQAAHRDTLDQYFRARITSNADVLAPSQSVIVSPGATQSRVDLRGLGSQRTLALIDGRRIPGLPSRFTDFDQADINGVPINAIERIETLTGTAGGIYGAGAIGGVVNVILRRDYRGAEIFATTGISSRGDAARMRLEGRIGFTPDGGTTDMMLYGAVSVGQRLRYGQRDYDERSRRLRYANDPEGYVSIPGQATVPLTNSILIATADRSLLAFDAQNGGASLGSNFTYLPLNFQGNDAERRAALIANAGQVDLTAPTDFSGTRRNLLNNPEVISGLLNVRRRLAPGVEAFVDGLYFRNHGSTVYALPSPTIFTLADAPSNPFRQRVAFRFPTGVTSTVTADSNLYRIIAGLIADLPGGWRGSAEYAFGAARYELTETSSIASGNSYTTAIATGLPGADGRPALFPLDDWATFQSDLATYFGAQGGTVPIVNRFTNATLRLGGPVLRLPGGDLALNLLLERRRERIPDTYLDIRALDQLFSVTIQQRTQVVRSAYAELRAPLVTADSNAFPLRGLELQLAARYDGLSARIPESGNLIDEPMQPLISIRRNALVFTVGARTFLLPRVMVRGSFATGRLPPTLTQIQEVLSPLLPASRLPDPLRGGRELTSEGPVTVSSGGFNGILQERGRTFSLGAVLNPEGRDGPRLSVDYSRISTRREIGPSGLSAAELVEREALYPDRVIRAALTDEDRALGFTGGRILRLNLGQGNLGRRIVETVDVQFDWQIGDVLGGDLAPYAQATWLRSVRTRAAPNLPWIERTGFMDGPVRWRANGGATWTRGATAIDLNLQYFHSYRVISATSAVIPTLPISEVLLLRFQARDRIPAQVYLDLAARRRFEITVSGPLRSVELRLGILNLLDHSPPILADPGSLGYSAYGDPRRRRFELVVASEF